MNSDNKLFCGNFGLERETLRVDKHGTLAQTAHPFADNKYLDRDFCENQLELITPICQSSDALMESLSSLDKFAKSELQKNGEYLWMNSNPPLVKDASEIPMAVYSGAMAFKHDYRKHLESRYGKRLMLYSGIHFNFSFADTSAENNDSVYFRLSKQVFRYSWLLVLLTAASPVCDKSLCGRGESGTFFDGYASYRNSEKGYWNRFIPILDYTDLGSYVNSINEYIKNGALFSAGELYLPVRLKSAGQNSPEALLSRGVNHIELRMFDLNPLSPVGIFKSDIDFAHYFLLYLKNLPDFEFTPELQIAAVNNHKAASRYKLSDIRINSYSAEDAAMGLLTDMEEYFKAYPNILENISLQKKKITENRRYCVRVYDMLSDDYCGNMLRLITEKEAYTDFSA